MDPLSLAVRALFTYIVLLALLRLSGKRTVRQATAFDLVLTIIIGDLVDNALWNEVPFTHFLVAAATLIGAHAAVSRLRMRSARVH